ncbi:acylneuraminate cytidylyltransferase family protein [uncultured Roseivirga sp.]|uniref:acylneuraminate cytidylyltransferase family protein n=1 Tax=uncultured Roseivirga sp. TaxID=543088 RepID=UPI00258BFAB3|nr:acylneuraminate cytidylyltransferase family protein [uncultured Roseivirga sp.]
MKPLVVIPARGGSKGLPGKNIKVLNGKPLICHTIEAARKVFEDESIIVSTDSNEIKNVSEDCGVFVPFLRPPELSTDTASSQDVVLHAIDWYEKNRKEVDTIILLQPTSPFRTSIHIKEALKLYSSSLDMVVSVKLSKTNPYFNLFEETEEGYLRKSKEAKATRRQDVPQVWEFNGAIYIMNVNSIKNKKIGDFTKSIKYEMDSVSSIDIDDQLDWELAKILLEMRRTSL